MGRNSRNALPELIGIGCDQSWSNQGEARIGHHFSYSDTLIPSPFESVLCIILHCGCPA
jgi:ligand-binding SRPBCC domain-containing protein